MPPYFCKKTLRMCIFSTIKHVLHINCCTFASEKNDNKHKIKFNQSAETR